MSDYTQITDFSAKDALSTGDPEKIISGADVDAELAAIQTAVGTKVNKVGSPTADNIVTMDSNGDAKDSTFAVGFLVPIGGIIPYTVATPPTGWLECDGSAVSRTTYSDLFAVISTTYGVGDGSTTFNLPDLVGRSVIGVGTGDATDATAHTLGEKEGTETHTLTAAEMPSHTHTGPSHTHAAGTLTYSIASSGSGSDTRAAGTNSAETAARAVGGSTAAGGTGATGSAGSDTAHNNLSPSIALHWIIRT